jgi:hypothetical protein
MKTRCAFVSNSSSSSFVISKKNLTALQLDQIKNHGMLAKEMGLLSADETWDIIETDESISGSTWMDNLDMHEFLRKIGVSENDPKIVEWDDYPIMTPKDLSNMTDSMDNEMVEIITDNIVKYLTNKMTKCESWIYEDIFEIVRKEVVL